MCRQWGAGVPCCLASLLSLWPAHEALGWLCQTVIGASPGCCVSTHWPALGCMVMKAASVKNLGVQGDCLARAGFGPQDQQGFWHGALNLGHLCLFQRAAPGGQTG